ncbi:MAG TPA: proton-conducting transporter membrane subunit, partial [Candidatus Eisenbacteria bacterium]
IAAAPRTLFRVADGTVEPNGVAALVLVTSGLFLLLGRWTGTVLGGDLGTAVAADVRALPWRAIVAFLAIVPMVRGTLTALTADRTSRVARGLIEAQVGWFLAGAASDTIRGASAAMIALITALPAFLAASRFPDRDDRAVTPPSHLALLATAVILFSLAGLPGTAGFIGRWSLVEATRLGASWWLILPGVVLWGMNFVAIFRWIVTPPLRRDVTLTPSVVILALVVLAGVLGGAALNDLLADVFPFY